MKIITSASVILFLAIMPNFNVAHTHDCYYDEPTKHVEYICSGPIGNHFDHRTFQILYCHNYESGIHRNDIKSLSFRDCSFSGMSNLNLWHFSSLRVLNISHFGFESLSERLLRHNPSLFSNLGELETLDLSNNNIEKIHPYLFVRNKQLKTLNLNNNQMKRLDCNLLANLPENSELDVFVNTLEEIQTICNIDEKHFDLDIVVTPKETATRLHVSNGTFKWSFTETEFTKLHRMNLSNGLQIKRFIETIDDIDIDESNLIMWQLSAIEYLLAFMVLILIFVGVFFIATCNRSRNYDKNLSIFSIEQSLMRNNENQYQKINSQQNC